MWKCDSKIKRLLVLIIHRTQCYGSRKWRWLILWTSQNPPDRFLEKFSKLRDAGLEDCLGSEQDHPEFPVQQEGQSRGTEGPEGGPVSTRKTDRVHDLRLLSSDWRS